MNNIPPGYNENGEYTWYAVKPLPYKERVSWDEPLKDAKNASIAAGWEGLLARIFGKTVIGMDGDVCVLLKEWRGKLYFIKVYSPIKNDKEK